MQGIYRIRNKLDDKRYVGSTNDFEKGWKSRCQALRRGSYYNIHLQRAWNKYGEENFVFEIEEEVAGDNKALLPREQVYLDEGFELGILYNVARKAGGGNLGEEVNQKLRGENNPMFGKQHTVESKRKNSVARKAWHKVNEHPKGMLGKHHTEEVKQKQSERMSGENNPFYGKDMSGENNPMYGKKRPEHSKQMTGEGNPRYGKPAWNRGKQRSKECKQKIGNSVAKLYPAFYNVKTNEFIPAGENLLMMCRNHGLCQATMWRLKEGITQQTKDDWRLAG